MAPQLTAHKRPLATRTQIVDGPGGDFLAGARFAEDEDGGVVFCDLADQGDDVADGEGGTGRQPHPDALFSARVSLVVGRFPGAIPG